MERVTPKLARQGRTNRRPQRSARTGQWMAVDRAAIGRSSSFTAVRGPAGDVGEGGEVSSAHPVLRRWRTTAKRGLYVRRRRGNFGQAPLFGSSLLQAYSPWQNSLFAAALARGAAQGHPAFLVQSRARRRGARSHRRECGPCPDRCIGARRGQSRAHRLCGAGCIAGRAQLAVRPSAYLGDQRRNGDGMI